MKLFSQNRRFWVLLLILLAGGASVHWREVAGEIKPERKTLNQFPEKLGEWKKFGLDQRFDADIESVLKADDYILRDYFLPSGKVGNLYVGYYNSQRSGATYHSPRNCLPGSGWTMNDHELVEISLPDGRKFAANRYLLKNNDDRYVMIYWYQGRGRFVASEYTDKFYTILDSLRHRRSDAAMVRLLVPANNNDDSADAALDFASQTAAYLSEFVPN